MQNGRGNSGQLLFSSYLRSFSRPNSIGLLNTFVSRKVGAVPIFSDDRGGTKPPTRYLLTVGTL